MPKARKDVTRTTLSVFKQNTPLYDRIYCLASSSDTWNSICVHRSCGLDVGFWLQRLTDRTPTASVCCVLKQDTLSALLQSTKL